ncbi:unnamed protein product, partial [Nesidiocoris tenuis]
QLAHREVERDEILSHGRLRRQFVGRIDVGRRRDRVVRQIPGQVSRVLPHQVPWPDHMVVELQIGWNVRILRIRISFWCQ